LARFSGVSYVWDVIDEETISQPAPPSTLKVLGLLALTALTFSYLGAYAVTGALAAQQVIQPWSREHDPRLRWLATGFCVLMLLFMSAGEFLRRWSKSDFKAIDEMAEAAE
jgi:hypothetical protein